MTPFLSTHKFWTVKGTTQVMPSVLSAYKSGRYSYVTVHKPFTHINFIITVGHCMHFFICSYLKITFLSFLLVITSALKRSGPSIAIEKVIWAAIKKVCRPLVYKVTTTNSIQTQYGITLDVPCKVTGTNTSSIQLKY